MASSQEMRSKAQFFADLHRLDELADESDDERVLLPNPQESSDDIANTGVHLQAAKALRISTPHQAKANTASKQGRQPSYTQGETRSKGDGAASNQVRKDMPTPKASGKPLRKGKAKPVPEEDQIFNGYTFYFVPNNDIAAPRRRRIEKALEYGAVWAKLWSSHVTHVVVDSNHDLDDAVKCIGSEEYLLRADIHFVNDRWLTESIGYKELRDPNKSRFEVPGGSAIFKRRSGEPSVICEDARNSPRQGVTVEKGCNWARKSSIHVVEAEPLIDDANMNKSQSLPLNALSEIMQELIGLQDLPLDLEDDQTADSFTFFGSNSIDNRDAVASERQTGIFQCMAKNDGTTHADNPNAGTIEILQKMATYYDRIGDNWRTIAYRKCLVALRKQPTPITTKEEALALPMIGERLASKIEEIVTTNKLRRLDSTASDPNDRLLQLFMGIYQVGLPSAQRWIAQGYRSLEELQTNPDLTANQRIGIEHYEDFSKRIPRAEVDQLAMIVRKALGVVDPELQLVVGGSYRRGSTESGDIDLIITKRDATLDQVRVLLMESVVPNLLRSKFLKVGLAVGASPNEGSKWHGACALPGSPVWRRIDLLFVPWDELGAALIYFTGNDIFNRSMRLLASRKGMRLNQHGLYKDVMRGKKRQKMTDGTLVESRDEKRIFDILGVPWRPPEQRQC